MRVGVFFGGQSREREVSFAGGRTVYDNLNKSLFEPIPVFVDSIGSFILLDWQYVYKGTIRDFYPPANFTRQEEDQYPVYIESLEGLQEKEIDDIISSVGTRIYPSQFKDLFDFAFLTLHGPYGEDGNIQGLLEWYNIPYSGSGIYTSALGVNKIIQKGTLEANGFSTPKYEVVDVDDWRQDSQAVFSRVNEKIHFPLVVKSPNQGSSIGVGVVQHADLDAFNRAVQKSLFILNMDIKDWNQKTEKEKEVFLLELTDIRSGIGFPIYYRDQKIYHPEQLKFILDNTTAKSLELKTDYRESAVLIEEFIAGREFSCIVLQDKNGNPKALPPTEIKKGREVFDYRSKYLPGMSRKVTPIDLPNDQITKIRRECERLFKVLSAEVYMRIDGFITIDGDIILNDPNTTSGMLPSSFFFHQAAEIGLNPSQFLSYIVWSSLKARISSGKGAYLYENKLSNLEVRLSEIQSTKIRKTKLAVLLGGYSTERHISVESGRNIYEKLSSSDQYEAVPVFLSGNEDSFSFHILPINILLKDNADDIHQKVEKHTNSPILEHIREELSNITEMFTSDVLISPQEITLKDFPDLFDFVFIALHGRPGEDGSIQKELEKLNIPYNGSSSKSSSITINKYETNEILARNGISVAKHGLVHKSEFESEQVDLFNNIEFEFEYPLIAKPADDGCSSAVKKINNRDELTAFANLMFRSDEELLPMESKVLNLDSKEEFPIKDYFLIEELIDAGDADHFLEITGGLLTHRSPSGKIDYEVFEPSEALASGEILSLEEKFLAGEGRNITPARFSKVEVYQRQISDQVRNELEKVARILGVEGYCRIDAFVRIYNQNEVEVVIIEVNSLPGMTPATCIYHQSALNGYSPFDFIQGIIKYGTKSTEVGA